MPPSDPQKSELYGRALVVIAAEQYASRLVVPSSQQHSPIRWPSHKDHARKALAKLAGPHLPVTLKQVEKAVAKAHSEQEKTTSGDTTTSRAPGGDDETSVEELADADALDVDEHQEVQALSSNIVGGPSPTGAAVMTVVGSDERERYLWSR